MESLIAEVLPVGNNAFEPLPTLAHNGTKYVIAEAETEWELRVTILNARKRQRYRVHVKLDGKFLGYTKSATCHSSRHSPSVVFEGFGSTDPNTGNRAYKAFKFGALKPAEHAVTIQHLDQIQAGRIEVACEAVVITGRRKDNTHHDDTSWATDAANKKLPEGKKWFLQPGLQAQEGNTTKQKTDGWGYTPCAVMYTLPVLKLRYDTADNLRLRKILDPAKPQHAALLARSSNAGVAGSSSSASRQPKQERRAAGVKREWGADQQQQAAAAASEGPAVPRSATAETINLADDAPAPLRVGGRVLAADELAVCDLAGSDDEEGGGPVWKVQKKQAIEVVV